MLLHQLCEIAGIFIAFRYYQWLKRKNGDTISTFNRLAIVAAATFGAVAGSHILGTLEDVPSLLSSSNKLKYFIGNKTILGGLLGGLFAVETTKKMLHETQNTGDLFVFPLILGMIIGRIGCFSAGIFEETYGVPANLPWAMDLGDGILRHPVALYEIVFLLLLWLMLASVNKNSKLQQGSLFKLFMMAYLVFRLLLDFIKPGWTFVVGLGSIQLSCLAGLLYYYRYILNPKLLL